PRRPARSRPRGSSPPPARPRSLACRESSLDAEQFHLEEQGRVRRDRADAPLSVRQIGGDEEQALPADLHQGDALIPAPDHPAAPDREGERLAPILGTVE